MSTNYPPNPDWQSNQQPDYNQGGYAQPTQYQSSYDPSNPYGSQNPYAPQNPYAQGQGQMQQSFAPARDKRGGFAIAGLVLGILSIPAAILPLCGFPVSIVGIVMAALGRASVSRRTMATIGLVLAIIGIVLTIASASYGAYVATHP